MAGTPSRDELELEIDEWLGSGGWHEEPCKRDRHDRKPRRCEPRGDRPVLHRRILAAARDGPIDEQHACGHSCAKHHGKWRYVQERRYRNNLRPTMAINKKIVADPSQDVLRLCNRLRAEE